VCWRRDEEKGSEEKGVRSKEGEVYKEITKRGCPLSSSRTSIARYLATSTG